MATAARPIRFASFLGDNGFEFYSEVVGYLGQVTGLATEMISAPTADQHAQLTAGHLEAAFTCGLPFVMWLRSSQAPGVRPLAAPVLLADRYADRPIYYSDVIVRRDSPFQIFADLCGARFAYNERTSFSGYVIMCYRLLTLGETFDYFGATLESGAHAISMDWVEEGRADVAAIDSVVLEMELLQRPSRRSSFRVVASLGPAGMPPLLASCRLGDEACERLQAALLSMHRTPHGRRILRRGGVKRFAAVDEHDYEDIGQIVEALELEQQASDFAR